MKTVLALMIAPWIIYVAYDMIVQYVSTSGNTEDRLKAAFRHSKTLLIQRLVQLGVGGLAVGAFAADALGLPGVSEAAKNMLPPAYWSEFIAVISILSELARRYKPGNPS